MKWCKECVLPDSRPNLQIEDDGICNACKNHKTKKDIDWKSRQNQLNLLVDSIKNRSSEYDCLIPVSGGKDSTWQTLKCLELGLKPLAVTWKTPARTIIGDNNLDNLINLGVDHIDFTINPNIEAKFMWETYKKKGSLAIPMHFAIYNLPLKIAAKYNIPLVIYGENTAFEYGSLNQSDEGFELTSLWADRYNATVGTKIEDWFSIELTEKDLRAYTRPTDSELSKVRAIFLGHYFKWDPEIVQEEVSKFGFMRDKAGPRTGLYNYADIDCEFISLHHWIKWYKFGFTRLFDNLSLEIRNGRLSREDALQMIRENDFEPNYDDVESFCKFTDHTIEDFMNVAETFRSTSIWQKDSNVKSHWYIKDFIINDYKWF